MAALRAADRPRVEDEELAVAGAEPDPLPRPAAELGQAEQVAPEAERPVEVGDVEVDRAVGERLAVVEDRRRGGVESLVAGRRVH